MMNLPTKHVVISRDIIWLKNNYGDYVTRFEYTIQMDVSFNMKKNVWVGMRMNIIKTKYVNTDQDNREEADVHVTIYFVKIENKEQYDGKYGNVKGI